jgi:hypothetical protein
MEAPEMRHTVFAPDALFAGQEGVVEPGRVEVQRPIRVVPFADLAPGARRYDPADDSELIRRLEELTRDA